MKKFLMLIVILAVTQFSCKKPNSTDSTPTSLDGNWKMIIVTDNTTGLTITKPISIQKDVEITFISASQTVGTFFGYTPTNDIWENDYFIGTNQNITIPVLSMTKVDETTWGNEFVDNICSSQKYSFEAEGKLIIKTTNKTLTFQKQ